MSNNLKTLFKTDLQKLVGKKCWGISEGTGSMISFDFGKKIQRTEVLDNDYLSEEVKSFDSEFSLFVHCVWRVDSTQNVIFGSWTEHEIVHREINQILGQTVKEIDLYEPAFDLKVIFSNDFQLNIFCDQTNEGDNNENYDYFTPKMIYTVGNKSLLTKTKHD